jgi:hypothetical protein
MKKSHPYAEWLVKRASRFFQVISNEHSATTHLKYEMLGDQDKQKRG